MSNDLALLIVNKYKIYWLYKILCFVGVGVLRLVLGGFVTLGFGGFVTLGVGVTLLGF